MDRKDRVLGLLKEKLGIECLSDGAKYKFLLLLFNETDNTYIGIVSTSALYYSGRGSIDRNEHALRSYSANFQIYKLIDDVFVLQKSTLNGLSFNTKFDCYANYNKYFLFVNYHIVHSNYPVYYGVKREAGAAENDDKYSGTNKRLSFFRNADEPYTLGMLPAGAIIKHGRTKLNGSEMYDLTWAIAGYTNNMKNKSKVQFYQEDLVYLVNEHIVDILPVNNVEDKKNEGSQDLNSELLKMLNSTKSNWWYPSFDSDIEPINTNFVNREGWLKYWTKGELEVINNTALYSDSKEADVYGSAKIHLASTHEIKSSTSTVANAKNVNTLILNLKNYYYERPLFHKFLLHHENKLTESDMTKVNGSYWKRERSSTGTQITLGSSYTNQDTPDNVRPIMFMTENKEVIFDKEKEEYIIVLPKIEVFREERETSSARNILNNNDFKSALEKKATVLDFGVHNTDILYVYSHSAETHLKRIIRAKKRYSVNLKRRRVRFLDKKYFLKRSLNTSESALHSMNRKIIGVISELINTHLERAITAQESSEYGTSRDIKYTDMVNTPLQKSTTIAEKIDYDSKRKILSVEFKLTDTLRVVVKLEHCIYEEFATRKITRREKIREEVERTVKASEDIENALNRKTLSVESILTDTLRSFLLNEDSKTPMKRQVISLDILDSDSNRSVVVNEDNADELLRQVNTQLSEILDTTRQVISSTEEDSYMRRIATVEFIDCQNTYRNIINTIAIDENTIRIIKDSVKLGSIVLIEKKVEKNKIGQSSIEYKKVCDIKGRVYPVQNAIQNIPIGLSDKVKYLLITKDRKIKSDNLIEVDGVVYCIDMLTNYSKHREIFLREV